MMVQYLTIKQAENRMNAMGNRPFRVTFRKRTDGTIRTMKVKNGVRDATKGGSLGYDPKNHNLRHVVDLDAMLMGSGWRMIPLDQVVSITGA
tara:strand:- start:804 stop:1079 length:276 start_codon:yes stop_codon:yes gene_type:complete